MKRILFFMLLSLWAVAVFAQPKLPTIKPLTSGTATSIRGLSVVSDRVVWVSGSGGTVGKSTDGGTTWKWMKVTHFEKADFRDIEAFDATTALIMAVDTPATILKTTDGGANWKVVYENKKAGMFLDAMEFWNSQSGVVVGDPINGKLFMARSFDGGASWQELPEAYKPPADSGEAMFASSGTNIRALDRDEAVFVTGGTKSRIYIRDKITVLPLLQGTASTGANSVAVWDHQKLNGGKQLIVVGGDFAKDTVTTNNCFYSYNRGVTWQRPQTPPHGYRSCVEYIDQKELITCGTSGIDFSADGGANWALISREGYHVCKKAKDGKAVYLAGGKGRVAKLEF